MTQIEPIEDSIYIEISGSLDVADYICDVPFNDAIESLQISEHRQPLVRDIALQSHLKQEIQDWISPKKSGMHGGIAITIIVFFGISLLAEFLLIGLGSFYPQSNGDLIKDTLPLMMNSLTAIVCLALSFYFKEK
jgi:hypothetical protein